MNFISVNLYMLASLCAVFSAYSYADIYRWTDEEGKVHYSDRKLGGEAKIEELGVLSNNESAIRLDVPLVKQGKALCGPATIEMLFRYWGENRYNQYDIAYGIINQFRDSKRIKKSKILEDHPIDWGRYPGTGTSTMREFLKRFATVDNPKIKKLSSSKFKANSERNRLFAKLKRNISQGIPVIVHQYWAGVGSRGHYRLVTGYDDTKREVYLNDSTQGKAVVQSYEKFLTLWNVDEPWLHYNAIVFNTVKRPLVVEMEKYETL